MGRDSFLYRLILQSPFFIALLLVIVFYFLVYYLGDIGYQYGSVSDELKVFANFHDHFIYYKSLTELDGQGFIYKFNNDFGIAFVYDVVYKRLGFYYIVDIYLFALFFNLIFLLFVFYLYNKICQLEGLSHLVSAMFFLNFSVIYFSQLINKDMLTLYFLLLSLYFAVKKKYFLIFCLIPISFFVRQQLALCIFTYLVLLNVKQVKLTMFLVYIMSTLAAGYISVHFSFISDQSLGDGLSYFIKTFNNYFYYLGYFVFNPVRVIQYFYSVPQSLLTLYNGRFFDFAALLRVLSFPLVIYSVLFIYGLVKNFKYSLLISQKPYALLVYSFFVCWLMNPSINARYFMLILPVMVLGYFVYKKNIKLRE